MEQTKTYTIDETLDMVRHTEGFSRMFEMHQQELLAAVRTKTLKGMELGPYFPLPVSNGIHVDFTGGRATYRITMIRGTYTLVRMAF